ncbi:hypothetical protein HELRODRAFT_177418 [Helobdella robusta]|uniref:C2 domain-containing protein n=1 Tax=Helobdella robusta TaxID=6412 RepID=T1FBN5_HELRO|nr:hypothetical protein HELRODRAFT_177418 [Helobdella robusta]ESN98173.1 hypothetical protein HELRODRAFT_177418 [Helobdella robusta]
MADKIEEKAPAKRPDPKPEKREDKKEEKPKQDKPKKMRLKVIEARQLPGANVSPTCRVSCYNQKKQTKVIQLSNSPFWNELFFFNFNDSPAELFDELLLFEVYDSKKLRADSFIGSFKIEVGMIYDEPNHCFVNKWLLLSDPEQVSDGHKGYLKISVALLGPGDDPPSFESTKYGSTTGDDDIEANLLRPAGLVLRPATFKLKLFCAEDLPRRTLHLLTSQISQVGNEAICKDAQIVLNAALTAKSLPTPGVKVKAPGYLPMFGPCFVNFYGSPREFSDLPTEFDELNSGKGVGVAYRGRVMIELQTVLGELPLTPIEDLTNEDIMKAQKFMRRRKFKLHSTFLDATMISINDSPVEFEVSIGNYGNRLDEFLPPSVCSTQPTNPVFDGCFYYYLPWADAKPCVVIESHWEDESQMNNIRLAQKGNVGLTELAMSVIKILDDIISECQKPLPEPNPECQTSNILDRNLSEYRKAVLANIVKEAKKLREEATDIDESLNEPQNSIPDVMIWMITGEKRIAYYRIPSNLVIWSPNPDYRGKHCGHLTTFMLQYPGSKAVKENRWEVPAMIRGRIWLGLEKDEKEWHQMSKEGELTVFAETYENQVNVLGKWTNRGPTMSRPKWTDVTGKIELNKEQFYPPPGWVWDDDWYINPELSMLFEKDANHTTFMEDVYECQSRIVGGNWKPAAVPYSDVKGDACSGIKEIELPAGWEWQDDWQVDLNRAVDENGWEYAADVTLGGYGPVEKMFHMCRRRRWLRTRNLVKTQSMQAEQVKQKEMFAEGWEYAPLFTMTFHLKERKMDLVRRRRWHRKMVPESKKEANSAIFQFSTALEEEKEEMEKDEDEEGDGDGGEKKKTDEDAIAKSVTSAPRMFMYAKKGFRYQLRAYIYQARDLLAGDSNGLSDPFARIIFLSQSQSTEKIMKTLCPTWDQTLIFESVKIWGDPKNVFEYPPDVIMEIFDFDTFGSAQYLGRAFGKPVVKLDPTDTKQPVLLKWYPVKKGDQDGGEVLAAFELLLIDGPKEPPFPPPKRGNFYMVPNGIRPQMARTAVEVIHQSIPVDIGVLLLARQLFSHVMCWGLRNMKKFQLLEVSSPNVEIEINGTILESKVIRDMSKNPNFDDPMLFFDVMLPKEELYAPPINIRVKDNRAFGRRPLVGIHTITSLEPYRCDPDDLENDEDSDKSNQLAGSLFNNAVQRKASVMSVKSKDMVLAIEEEVDEDIDWWSKFYASVGEMDKCKKYVDLGYDKLQVYATELEKVKVHREFNDFCSTFPLTRGKAIDDEEGTVAGEFKGTFYVYPLPGDLQAPMPPRILKNLPTSGPVECLADPYIQIKIGKTKVENNNEYIPNTLNPVFGK